MSLKKSFGQHFLQDINAIFQIVSAVQPEPEELIVEVGPGSGALTKDLATFSNPLVLIEADRDLISNLEKRFPDALVILADAAAVDYDAITQGRPWVFVSNLPYNAANAILEKVFQSDSLPDRLIIMVQREVGERMMAKPGEMSVLSIAMQLYCSFEKICCVGPEAFVPSPKVDSIVLRLTPKHKKGGDPLFEAVIAFAKIGFAHRRKQLRRTLAEAGVASIYDIDEALVFFGFPKTIRPQELSVENWIELFQKFKR